LQSAAKINKFGLHFVEINQQFNASSPIPAALGTFYPTNPHQQIPKKQCSVNTSYFCQEVTLGAAEYCKTRISAINGIPLHINFSPCLIRDHATSVCVCVWRRAAVAWHVNSTNGWKSSASQPGWVSPKSWPTQCREQNMLLSLSNINPISKHQAHRLVTTLTELL
jgi:hypothetical protein